MSPDETLLLELEDNKTALLGELLVSLKALSEVLGQDDPEPGDITAGLSKLSDLKERIDELDRRIAPLVSSSPEPREALGRVRARQNELLAKASEINEELLEAAGDARDGLFSRLSGINRSRSLSARYNDESVRPGFLLDLKE